MPVDVMSSCAALYQGGQPWPAGCTSLFSQVLPSSGHMVGGSTKTQCPTCLVGGCNTPTAVDVAFVAHTACPTLLVRHCVHVSGCYIIVWHQRGWPWPTGCTISTRKKFAMQLKFFECCAPSSCMALLVGCCTHVIMEVQVVQKSMHTKWR